MLRRIAPSRLGGGQRWISLSPACSSSSAEPDHYKVLGLQPGADAKDIKSAYYKLSKQFHPDTNPDKKEEAAKKFHQVAQAYEILGSEDRRKAYDMTRIRTSPMASGPEMSNRYRRRSSGRQYTDIDIDYKDFEHFQRSTRRRPQFHSHFDMPNEFYAEFGGFKRRVYKSEFDETERNSTMYKDSRAVQREMEELRRQMEREKAEQQARYPIPTFEQMIRERRAKEAKEARQYMAGLFLAAILAGFLTTMLTR
ncbi:unnamed protein product [Caenorhabditis bovis]|uniref:J domain-containing protein n=1 Tax=Caenorhabditis bovis TaxID=2654633 RepID=A0A8S1ESQ6_9PELO|nr:unnamed protein product [Caenorhabditis bovis]